MEAVFFLMWFGLCVFTGAVASNKGRSFIGFFLLAIFISPIIALIIVLCVRDLKNKEDTGSMRRCPKCAELIKMQAKICKHCGNEDLPVFKNPDLTESHIAAIQKIVDSGIEYDRLSEIVLGEIIPIESLTPSQASMIIQNADSVKRKM